MDINSLLKKLNLDKALGSAALENLDITGIAEKVRAKLNKELQEMNHANIILAGKTGAGKSTLVNAVFREKFAETAIGEPVTQEIRVYTKEGMPIRIYDSKGLELSQESQKQLKRDISNTIQEKLQSGNPDQFIHAIWYCISTASDRIEEAEIEWINELGRCGAQAVPVILVLTKSYSKKSGLELKKFIENKNLNVKAIVPVLAEEFEIDEEMKVPDYGLEELVGITFQVLPDSSRKAFINAQQVSIGLKEKAARKYINSFAVTTFVEGAVPVPWADAPMLVATQIAMISSITAVFGIDMDRAMLTAILGSIIGGTGATLVGRSIAGNIFKMVPGVGTIVGGSISGATALIITKALGETYVKIMVMVCKGELDPTNLTSKNIANKMRAIFKSELERESKSAKGVAGKVRVLLKTKKKKDKAAQIEDSKEVVNKALNGEK